MVQQIQKEQKAAFALLGVTSIVSVLLAFKTEAYYIALIPFALLIGFIALTNFKFLYFLLLASLPVSIEFNFTPSLGTDLPDEPLMIGLMLITMLHVARNPQSLPKGFFVHVLMLGLAVHLFWIFTTAFTSVNTLVSFKVFLSKIWYITTFSALTAIVVKTEEDLKKAFWCIYFPLTALIIVVLIRHGMMGFSFDEINKPMMPFFRNHVNYAAIVVIFLPFIWLARQWYKRGTFTYRLLSFSLLLYVAAIYFSYTRTCYIALLFIPVFVWVVKNRLMKHALVLTLVAACGLVFYLLHNNKYLDYAPDFRETIIHDEFGEHLSSTFEGKDVSSMERVYRWVAILQMFKERPVFGFGPGNFYPYYKHYTVSSFETYVSDNPERSTAHNYFLLLLAEQGVAGVVVFALFTIVIFAYGEHIYLRMKSENDKRVVMVLLVVLAMIYVNLMLSDLLESDKVGPFFFICLGLLAAYDIRNRLLEAKA
ncbi:MAG: O-antigen ligase family protein [Chitinophagales bacterium]|nr:O-antigen ligase family protein [Chitinophagales bacterium]